MGINTKANQTNEGRNGITLGRAFPRKCQDRRWLPHRLETSTTGYSKYLTLNYLTVQLPANPTHNIPSVHKRPLPLESQTLPTTIPTLHDGRREHRPHHHRRDTPLPHRATRIPRKAPPNASRRTRSQEQEYPARHKRRTVTPSPPLPQQLLYGDLRIRELTKNHTRRAIQSAQLELERQQATDSLRKGLEKRPEREELIERTKKSHNCFQT